MQGERTVGGIRCSEVLAELSEYVDGRLSSEQRHRIEEHVGGCTNCARFGGTFEKVLKSIRAQPVAKTVEGTALTDRLMGRLDADLADE